MHGLTRPRTGSPRISASTVSISRRRTQGLRSMPILAGSALDLSLKATRPVACSRQSRSDRRPASCISILGGKGPLADWRGRLVLEAQNLARLETDLELGLAELPRIGIDGRLDVAPEVLPPEVEPLIGRTID